MWKNGNVFLNMDMEAGTYSLVCNYCDKPTNFRDFDHFLAHARVKHGPSSIVGATSVGHQIIKENETIIISDNDSHKLAPAKSVSASQVPALPLYNIHHVTRKCMMEIIELLSKCLCIWHKPTRLRTSRKERYCAYQLLLLKLQKFHPECDFKNVRSIIRQLITNYFSEHTTPVQEQDDEEENEDDKCALESPTISQTVIRKLVFLTKSDFKDDEKLNISNDCSFCGLTCCTTTSLWTHMIKEHLPRKKSSATSPALKRSSCSLPVDYCSHILHKNISSHLLDASKCERNTTEYCLSEYETDYFTENSESDWNQRTNRGRVRKSKKKSKRRRRRLNEPQPKRKKNIELTSETDATTDATDISNAEISPSSLSLSNYEDKFLEEFIDLYRQQECLWHRFFWSYRNVKLRRAAYEILLKKYRQNQNENTANISTIKKLIKRLRDYYRKLKKTNGNLHRSHIWKKLSFIDNECGLRTTAGLSVDISSEYVCSQCDKTYIKKKNFINHQLRRHPLTNCSECLENFGNADDLKKHILWFHSKATFCPLCKNSDVDWKLPQHLAEHFYDYTCYMCGQIFHDITNFQNHKVKCRVRNRFRCWHCDATFRGTMELRQHSNIQHSDERPFKCSYCEISFKFLAPLLKHRKIHKRLNHFRNVEYQCESN